MATILKRERKSGEPAWQAQIRIPGQRPILRTFDSEEQAKAFCKSAERQARESLLIRKSDNGASFFKEPFADAIALYLESSACIPRERRMAPTIQRSVGSVRLGDVKRSFARDYVQRMLREKTIVGRPFQPSTIGTHLTFMAKVYQWRADELGVDAPPHPFTRRLLPRGWDVGRERRLARHEEIALIKEIRSDRRQWPHHWRLLIALALATGARLQELTLSEWKEFNLEKGFWVIPAAHTKTSKARAVTLNKRARRALKILAMIRSDSSQRVFHCFKNADSVSAGFHRISLRAGLVNFRFHDFRHEAISRMVMSDKGVSPFVIMKMVGHRTTEMLNRYANLTGNDVAGLWD